MADKLEDLVNKAVRQSEQSNHSVTSANVRIERPMSLKHSYEGGLGKPVICNEGVGVSDINDKR